MIDWKKYPKAKYALVSFYDDSDELGTQEVSRPTQTKTVADAVEAFPGGYDSIPYSPESIEKEQVVLCAKKTFFEDGEEYVKGNLYQGQKDFDNEYFYQVCTRAEFEAYVKGREKPHFKATRENLMKIAKDAQGDFVEVKQEDEKWTHVVDDDEGQLTKCRKHLKLCNGSDWVYVCEKGEYFVPSKMGYCGVKPIKPTISEDAVSKLRAYANWTAGQESGYVSELIEEFIATHDII